ncbi:hypothetical protein PR048_025369 [Dryococelus australis]|uniref:YqaJ viral recombinase domain-containing protein n=1 Tax=Dryococelus australis TaxID=614101 RepID=A0ABQ9GR78_9NEOP|nr:hypothetical protein PR048_025369 [Dryococelus australis]
MKSSTPRAKTIISIIYSSFQGNKANRYGLEKEPIAIEQLSKELVKCIKPAGLFIDKDMPWLAAMPDGLIDHDSTIELRCPFSAAQRTSESAIRQNKIKFCLIENELRLKRNDSYMFQVRGQLQIANMKTCYFVVQTPLGMLFEIIERGTKFWEEKMVDKLNGFYMDHIRVGRRTASAGFATLISVSIENSTQHLCNRISWDYQPNFAIGNITFCHSKSYKLSSNAAIN